MPSNVYTYRTPHPSHGKHGKSEEPSSTNPAQEHKSEPAHLPAREDVARRIKNAAHSSANSSSAHQQKDRHGEGLESFLNKHYPDHKTVTNREVIRAFYKEFRTDRKAYAEADRRFGIDIDKLTKDRDAPFHISGKTEQPHPEAKRHSNSAAHEPSVKTEQPHADTKEQSTSPAADSKPPEPHPHKTETASETQRRGKLPGTPYTEFSVGHFDRGRFREELEHNKELLTELTKLAVKEVGGENPKLAVAFFESLFNRATREQLTIDQALHNGYYGPINTKKVDQVPEGTEDYKGAQNGLVTALEGTNVIDGRRHQEYRSWYAVAMGGDPKTFLRIGKEIFYNKFREKSSDKA